MAEDKRIRVSADTTPLQEVRQAARELWEDLAQMETNFKQINDGVLQSIQKQIDLLKERNNLYTAFNPQAQPNGRDGYNPRNTGLIDPYTGRQITNQPNNRIDLPNSKGIDTVIFDKQLTSLDRIFSAVTRISDILEQGQRHETNTPSSPSGGSLPLPGGGNTPPVPSGASPVAGKGGFRLPTNLQGLVGMMPYGAAAFAAASLIGNAFVDSSQYDLRQYSATDEFQRRNQTHWLVQRIPWFGKLTEQENEKQNLGLEAARRFSEPVSEFASLNNLSYQQALSQVIKGTTDAGAYVSATSRALEKEGGVVSANPRRSMSVFDAGIQANNSARLLVGDPSAGIPSAGAVARVEANDKAKGIDEFQVRNWASNTLGLNLTDYLKEFTTLSRAGVYGSNTGDFSDVNGSVNQLLMAGKIRGLSTSDMTDVLASTRFDRRAMATNGAQSGMTGANVVQAFDTNLQGLGKSDQYIAATLGEYLAQFNRITEDVLNKTGSIDTEKIVGSMTSIQNATGMEGRQLARVQDALMGGNISQDDTTQALLMRTARQLNPNGNYSDLMADIENMRQNPELQSSFLKKIYTMTGGGEMFRTAAKSIFPGMSWNDINSVDNLIKKGGSEEDITKGIDKIFKSGRTKGSPYNELNAQEKVSDFDRSKAETENRHIIDGLKEMAKQQGTDLEKIINKIYTDPLPVTISPEVTKQLGDIEASIMKFVNGLKNSIITLSKGY